MPDEFLPPKPTAARDIRKALTGVLFVAIAGLIWWTVQQRNWKMRIPEHVLNAPLAKHVGPDYHLSRLLDLQATGQNVTKSLDVQTGVGPKWNPNNGPPTAQPKRERPGNQRDFNPTNSTTQLDSENPVVPPLHADSQHDWNNPAPETDISNPIGLVGHTFQTEEESNGIEGRDVVLNPNPFASTPIRDLANDYVQRPRGPDSAEETNSTSTTDANGGLVHFVPTRPTALTSDANSAIQPDDPQAAWLSSRHADHKVELPVSTTDTYRQPNKFVAAQGDEPSAGNSPGNPRHPSIESPRSLAAVDEPSNSDGLPAADFPWSEVDPGLTADTSGEYSAELIRRHDVMSGDSFWTIAVRYYDDGRYFRALYEFNKPRGVDFNKLTSGTTIEVPAVIVLLKMYPQLCPSDAVRSSGYSDQAQRYVTLGGESLFEIARQTTGQASRYLEIMELNQHVLPNEVSHWTALAKGIVLILPHR